MSKSDLEKYNDIIFSIKKEGEHFPKKHGDWYKAKFLTGYLLLDTWNGQVSFFPKECNASGKDIYGNIVTFFGKNIFLYGKFNNLIVSENVKEFEKYFHLIGT